MADLTSGQDVDIASFDVSLPAGTNALGKVGHDATAVGSGRKVVTVAGTDEALAGSTSAKAVTITAETNNTGVIAVGGSGVTASLGTRTGVPLNPGDSISLAVDNLADVFIDSTVSGDGVTYAYLT